MIRYLYCENLGKKNRKEKLCWQCCNVHAVGFRIDTALEEESKTMGNNAVFPGIDDSDRDYSALYRAQCGCG